MDGGLDVKGKGVDIFLWMMYLQLGPSLHQLCECDGVTPFS